MPRSALTGVDFTVDVATLSSPYQDDREEWIEARTRDSLCPVSGNHQIVLDRGSVRV